MDAKPGARSGQLAGPDGSDTSDPTRSTADPTRSPTLTGSRVALRPLRADDVDDLYALYADPEVTRYWSFHPWTQRAQAEDYLRTRLSLHPPAVFCWAITHVDDRLIGTVTLFVLDAVHGSEIGYALSSPFQRRGLAGEALQLAIGFAFDALGLARIEADVDPRNDASWRLLERLGFFRETLLHDRCRRGNEVGDAAIYALRRAHRDAPGA